MANLFTSPTMMMVGAGLVSLPIIIHLLNRRRFKRVDWAAMDFLLEASRINRRRVQLQDLLLLLLRCLAILFIGALLARPFFTQDSGGDLRSGRFERVVILDDSPSMDTVDQGETPFDRAKAQLEAMISSLAEDTSENTLTLYLSSSPDAPVISGEPIDLDSLATRLDSIRALEVSDVPSDYMRVLKSVERSVARAKQEQNNQMVYVLTDFRNSDWSSAAMDEAAGGEADVPIVEGEEVSDTISGDTETLAGAIKQLAPQLSGMYLVAVDVGDTDNVLVESVTTDEMTIAGVTSRFTVTVRNTGDSRVEDLTLFFKAGRSLPVEQVVPPIDANSSQSVSFKYTFAAEDQEELIEGFAPDKGVPVTVSLSPKDRAASDALEADNTFFFPVRVSSGVRTLIVDGETSSVRGKAESFFLKRALSPRGSTLSGIATDVITDTELPGMNPNDYQVIFLLNVGEVPEEVVEKLEKWVSAGGGLCIATGGNVDEDRFNEFLYKEGKGLSPVKLVEIKGDERKENWASFDVLEQRHPILRHFDGPNSILIEGVKVFRWWTATTDPVATESGVTRVLAKWVPVKGDGPADDEEDKLGPAMVEQSFGKGKVIAYTTPLDLDWNDWVQEPSYLITMQETARYLSEVKVDGGLLETGEPIRMQLDLSRYRVDYEVKPPQGELRARAAVAPGGQPNVNAELVPWKIEDDGTRERGFYEVSLTPADNAEPEVVLFAANVDPREGNLELVNKEAIQTAMGEAPVTVVSGTSLAKLGANTAKMEFWRPVLYVLLGLLVFELFYGWWLGVKRGA